MRYNLIDPFIRADKMMDILQNDDRFKGEISHKDGKLVVNGQEIAAYTE
jgi:hypothetical protein